MPCAYPDINTNTAFNLSAKSGVRIQPKKCTAESFLYLYTRWHLTRSHRYFFYGSNNSKVMDGGSSVQVFPTVCIDSGEKQHLNRSHIFNQTPYPVPFLIFLPQ
jgi:hypothetical protein